MGQLRLKPTYIWFQRGCDLRHTPAISLILPASAVPILHLSIKYATLGRRGSGVGALKKCCQKCALLHVAITTGINYFGGYCTPWEMSRTWWPDKNQPGFSAHRISGRWLQDTGHAMWKPYPQSLREERCYLAECGTFGSLIPPMPYSPLWGCWLCLPSLQGTKAISNFPQAQHFFRLSGSFSWGCNVEHVVL